MGIKRYRANPRHVVETEFDDAEYVSVKDFDRVTAERDALQLRLNAVEEENDRLRMAAGDALQVIDWQIFGIPPSDGRSAPSSRYTQTILKALLEKRP